MSCIQDTSRKIMVLADQNNTQTTYSRLAHHNYTGIAIVSSVDLQASVTWLSTTFCWSCRPVCSPLTLQTVSVECLVAVAAFQILSTTFSIERSIPPCLWPVLVMRLLAGAWRHSCCTRMIAVEVRGVHHKLYTTFDYVTWDWSHMYT